MGGLAIDLAPLHHLHPERAAEHIGARRGGLRVELVRAIVRLPKAQETMTGTLIAWNTKKLAVSSAIVGVIGFAGLAVGAGIASADVTASSTASSSSTPSAAGGGQEPADSPSAPLVNDLNALRKAAIGGITSTLSTLSTLSGNVGGGEEPADITSGPTGAGTQPKSPQSLISSGTR